MSKKKQPKFKFSLKKIFILILGVLFLCFLMYKAADKIYNKDKYWFKNFKSTKEFEKVINKKFPIGSYGDQAKTFLEKKGAKCVFFTNKERSLTKRGWECDYGYWNWLVVYISFRAIIYLDEKNKIIKISPARYINAF